MFEVGETRLTTRLIEGEYPNYRNLLPSSYPNLLTVGREALLEALRRVKILAQDSTPVRLTLGGDTLQLTAITQDVGNAAEEIDASYDGAEMTVAFNPDYLASGIDAVEGDEVTLGHDGPDEAGGAARRRPRRLPLPPHARPRPLTRAGFVPGGVAPRRSLPGGSSGSSRLARNETDPGSVPQTNMYPCCSVSGCRSGEEPGDDRDGEEGCARDGDVGEDRVCPMASLAVAADQDDAGGEVGDRPLFRRR